MTEIQQLFDRYKEEAHALADKNIPELNNALIDLENRMIDSSGLKEGENMKLRAYMQEYRLKFMDGYEAGAV